jgi:tRNA A37 threonylcarbamoyladenosine modification protein TsaB
MIILTVRTDKPEAEIGLYDNEEQLVYVTWHAHRELAETIHKKIAELLISVKISDLDLSSEAAKISSSRERCKLSLNDIDGIVCFKGPGSFTGLRIGLTVGNALAYAQNIPIVARGNSEWLEKGIKDLLAGKNDKIAIPEYGAEAKTTKQRK